jgi:RNA polymerase sigma factor (sigma-70 family)
MQNIVFTPSSRTYIIDKPQNEYERFVNRTPVPSIEQEQLWTWQNYLMQCLKDSGKTAEEITAETGWSAIEIQRVMSEGKRARDRLVEGNQRLVWSIAKRQPPVPSIGLWDLVSEGNLGLIHALTKFNPLLGNKFCTYATPWIFAAISRSIDNTSSLIRVPVNACQNQRSVKRAIADLRMAGKQATPEAIAKLIQSRSRAKKVVTATRVKNLIEAPKVSESLDRQVGKYDSLKLKDVIPGDEQSPIDYALSVEINDAIAELSKEQRRILMLRLQGKSTRTIGKSIGRSQSGVNYHYFAALQKLRDRFQG